MNKNDVEKNVAADKTVEEASADSTVASAVSELESDVKAGADNVAADVKEAAAAVTSDVKEAAAKLDADVAQAAPELEAELRAEVDHWKDYARRAQAEFENTRKRLEARSADELRRAGSRFVTSLAPVIDDIELAMAHAADNDNEMADGLAAIHTKFIAALEREGVEVIDPKGQPFDSEVAQAVSVVDNNEVPNETVLDVLQKGYRMGGKTLRPAMVVVSKAG